MIRLGLKLTHDGGFALLDGAALICSHEAEKSANLKRHAPLDAIDIGDTLGRYGVALADVDQVIVDGWTEQQAETRREDRLLKVPVAPYHETESHRDPLEPVEHDALSLAGEPVAYRSYTHATGHAAGTYATSPWAAEQADALVLVWDGAMLPRLYHLDPSVPSVRPLRRLFAFAGHIYPVFGSYFGPFVPNGSRPSHDRLPQDALLDLSGKVMAWAGLGGVDEEIIAVLERTYAQTASLRWEFVFDFTRAVHREVQALGARDEDVIASFQAYLGRQLVAALRKTLDRDPSLPRRLCFTGGCALNIAWNAHLRASGLFEDVWVPPFPNDSGSALGCAVADLLRCGEGPAIEWDVYRGPPLMKSHPAPGWSAMRCDIPDLAAFLRDSGEPVVFLNGRAELGPRALGNRSVLCGAERPETKDLLNEIKIREWYRPVAPICLESRAPEVFDPGASDPYMLFVHHLRPSWRDRVPAIMHIDGTARLQTVREDQNPLVAGLLAEYERLTGIPLLCNTSANLKGKGFFPDLRSATDWPGARNVWCDGVLYSKVRDALPEAPARIGVSV